jgi:hypothetical protein
MRRRETENSVSGFREYARRARLGAPIVWRLIAIGMLAMATLAWGGHFWARRFAADFGEVLRGLVVSVIACMFGVIFTSLAALSLSLESTVLTRWRMLIVLLLLGIQLVACQLTDELFIRF